MRRSKRFLGIEKFQIIDGRRYQTIDETNYILPNDAIEEERLDLQHDYMKLGFGGMNYSAPVDEILRRGARVLDVGLVLVLALALVSKEERGNILWEDK
jgi:hypothetical protein